MVFNGTGATNSDRLKLYVDGVEIPLEYFLGNSIPTTTHNVAAQLIFGQQSGQGRAYGSNR